MVDESTPFLNDHVRTLRASKRRRGRAKYVSLDAAAEASMTTS